MAWSMSKVAPHAHLELTLVMFRPYRRQRASHRTMSTIIIVINCKLGPAVLALYHADDIVDCTYRPGRETQHQPITLSLNVV